MPTEMHSGTIFSLDQPVAAEVSIRDIAHHLSHICRFNGGTPSFYSVAEHSIMCLKWVERFSAVPVEVKLAALLHDAHEAYVGDIVTPVKNRLGKRYIDMRDRLDVAIAEKFSIEVSAFHSHFVKTADQVMLSVEAHFMMVSGGEGDFWSKLKVLTPFELALNRPRGMSPQKAKSEFIHEYNRLTAERVKNGGAATYAM